MRRNSNFRKSFEDDDASIPSVPRWWKIWAAAVLTIEIAVLGGVAWIIYTLVIWITSK